MTFQKIYLAIAVSTFWYATFPITNFGFANVVGKVAAIILIIIFIAAEIALIFKKDSKWYIAGSWLLLAAMHGIFMWWGLSVQENQLGTINVFYAAVMPIAKPFFWFAVRVVAIGWPAFKDLE